MIQQPEHREEIHSCFAFLVNITLISLLRLSGQTSSRWLKLFFCFAENEFKFKLDILLLLYEVNFTPLGRSPLKNKEYGKSNVSILADCVLKWCRPQANFKYSNIYSHASNFANIGKYSEWMKSAAALTFTLDVEQMGYCKRFLFTKHALSHLICTHFML